VFCALNGRKQPTADPRATSHPGIAKRVFTAEPPHQLWVMDVTFVATWARVAYVCFIIDVYSRMIVGWRFASDMRTETVLDAIEMVRETGTESVISLKRRRSHRPQVIKRWGNSVPTLSRQFLSGVGNVCSRRGAKLASTLISSPPRHQAPPGRCSLV
jgi:transposase InsO family protein